MGAVTIGVDIGQKHDPTAIAVAEVEFRQTGGHAEDYYLIRHLERLPIGTPYPAVVVRLGDVVDNTRKRGMAAAVAAAAASGSGVPLPPLALYVDATGVGQPVVDLLAHVGVPVTAVYFTHGDRRTVSEDRKTVSLGKTWLVSRLQALLQTGRILLPSTPEARQLAKELQDYEIRVDEKANDTYGAFKVGTHDDLVTALGLAVQETPRNADAPVAGGTRGGIRSAPYPSHPAVGSFPSPLRRRPF